MSNSESNLGSWTDGEGDTLHGRMLGSSDVMVIHTVKGEQISVGFVTLPEWDDLVASYIVAGYTR